MNHGTEAFWLLTEPFEADPDARFLIPTRPVRALLGGLRDALSSRPGWIVVVGEPGVGKSVLVRMLVESLGDHAPIAVIPDASVDFADLREQLDARLGERGAPVTTDTLLRAHRAGRRPLVVLDGAEELTDEAARDLDAMFAAPIEARPVALLVDLIAVVDTAPDAPLPEWARTRRPVKLVLGRLDAADTAEYVRRRVRLAAGGERDLFDAGALDEVFRRTAGRPDAINRLCGLALDRVGAAGHSLRSAHGSGRAAHAASTGAERGSRRASACDPRQRAASDAAPRGLSLRATAARSAHARLEARARGRSRLRDRSRAHTVARPARRRALPEDTGRRLV
jgi:type II secretory pathway predicted ATPase ExeA